MQHKSRGFRWPPTGLPAGDQSVTPAPEPAPAPAQRWGPLGEPLAIPAPLSWRQRLRRCIREAEIYWLAMQGGEFSLRAAEAGWQPDSAASFCPRCGVTSVGQETIDPALASDPAEAGCRDCRGQPIAWDRFLRLGGYEGLLRRAILETKFSRWKSLGFELGEELGKRVAASLAATGLEPCRVIIIPAPMTRWRFLLRGVHHTRAIARGVSKASGVPVVELLGRKHRPSQTWLSRPGRASNVAGAMYLRRVLPATTQAVILVDDVKTTGATLTEACRALRKAIRIHTGPVYVIAATLAVSPTGKRRTGSGAKG
jgi:predicted amidophosphoribosyltransferase